MQIFCLVALIVFGLFFTWSVITADNAKIYKEIENLK